MKPNTKFNSNYELSASIREAADDGQAILPNYVVLRRDDWERFQRLFNMQSVQKTRGWRLASF